MHKWITFPHREGVCSKQAHADFRMRQFMNVKLAEVDSSALRHIFIINMRQLVGVSGKVTYAHVLLTSP